MRNPWLDIPLDDYEAHMALVAQAQLLAGVLAERLGPPAPASVAVIGCAGGNGFAQLASAGVARVLGVDLNPRYLDAARERYGASIDRLELVEADIQRGIPAGAPVDLAYAALMLEYVEPEPALRNLAAMLAPGGRLVTVVQLPSDGPAVTPSPYTRLQALEPVMRFVAPDQVRAIAAGIGLHELGASTRGTPAGKQFAVQEFQRRERHAGFPG